MKNLFSLEKQRALITGPAGGIGSAVSKVSASLGAETILVDKVSTEPLVQELRSSSSVANGYLCDVRDRAAVEDICRQIGAIDAGPYNRNMEKIVSDNAEIFYDVAGSGPPVVLLHPFPANHEFWLPISRFFASRYQLIMPDLRGHGESSLADLSQLGTSESVKCI